jgi:hypothetical protein
MKTAQSKLSRRCFLIAATAGTAATAAAIVGHKVPDSSSKKDNRRESGQGYQLSAHVRNYYRTAKI